MRDAELNKYINWFINKSINQFNTDFWPNTCARIENVVLNPINFRTNPLADGTCEVEIWKYLFFYRKFVFAVEQRH